MNNTDLMKKDTHRETILSPGLRILIGAGFPAAVFLAVFCLLHARKGVPCLFYSLTGLYCPGCGSGRTLLAFLHGHPEAMFSGNILFVLMAPPLAGILLHEYLRLVFPGLHFRPVYMSQRIIRVLAAILILYGILRNIPAFAFLAPS